MASILLAAVHIAVAREEETEWTSAGFIGVGDCASCMRQQQQRAVDVVDHLRKIKQQQCDEVTCVLWWAISPTGSHEHLTTFVFGLAEK